MALDLVVPVRGFYSDHLVQLLGRAEAAAARLAAADPDRRATVAADARREQARRSVRLDASPLTDATADAVDARLAIGLPPTDAVAALSALQDGAAGGWAQALRLEGMQTEEVAAIEYANALAALDAEAELAADVLDAPLAVLARAHGLLVNGLVDPEVIGRLRGTEQALHDGAQGLVLYHAPTPEALPPRWEALGAWLGQGSAVLPAAVVAGVVHERILEWLPFEAANGRLARLAARLVLRARGMDLHGLAVPERVLAEDPVAYHAEVAATRRRRGDLRPWLERWAEALCRELEHAADTVDPRPAPVVGARARALLQTLAPGAEVTLAEHAARAGVRREAALADLRALERSGALRLVAGSRGLRWRRSEQTGA